MSNVALTLLTHDAPWPAVNGGRTRLEGLCDVLGSIAPTSVLVSVNTHRPIEVTAPAEALPACARSKVAALTSRRPRLGRGLIGAAAAAAVADRAGDSALLLVSHSYLVPLLPHLTKPLVVDFPNLEVERQRVAGMPFGRLEAFKARFWEPRVARLADLCLAVDQHDAEVLASWGARRVAVLPNAAQVGVLGPSPDAGYLLAVADWTYEPNRHSLAALEGITAPLVLAGRGSETLPNGRGFVDDLTGLYAGAAAVLAPATTGAGTQLKIVEAVCRGRVVVTTHYGMRSVPDAARSACLAGDLETLAATMVADVGERHRREAQLRGADLPRSWEIAARAARPALVEVARSGGLEL